MLAENKFHMKYNKYLAIVLIFVLLNCNEKVDNSNTIDIEQAFHKAQEIVLSDFVEHLEYIVLESEQPIDRNLIVYSSANYLICTAVRQIYVFDRHTGKFIREIGKYGNGPGEYSYPIYFDSKTQHVIAFKGDHLLEFDLNGKLIRTIVQPKSERGMMSGRILLDTDTVAYFIGNDRGNVKDRILIADEYGNVINSFGHIESFIPQIRVIQNSPPVFYHYGKNTMFFELCVDTIYLVTKDALIPHYHLNMGPYKPPYEKQNELFIPPDPLINQYFWFRNIGETEHFLFFDFDHTKRNSTNSSSGSFFGYYDKKRETVKIADIDKDGRRIINDIDHFGAIQLSSWTINNKGHEMIFYIEAVDIVTWFKQNPQKAKELPAHLLKLSTLNENDNPIVVIAKLKQ